MLAEPDAIGALRSRKHRQPRSEAIRNRAKGSPVCIGCRAAKQPDPRSFRNERKAFARGCQCYTETLFQIGAFRKAQYSSKLTTGGHFEQCLGSGTERPIQVSLEADRGVQATRDGHSVRQERPCEARGRRCLLPTRWKRTAAAHIRLSHRKVSCAGIMIALEVRRASANKPKISQETPHGVASVFRNISGPPATSIRNSSMRRASNPTQRPIRNTSQSQSHFSSRHLLEIGAE